MPNTALVWKRYIHVEHLQSAISNQLHGEGLPLVFNNEKNLKTKENKIYYDLGIYELKHRKCYGSKRINIYHNLTATMSNHKALYKRRNSHQYLAHLPKAHFITGTKVFCF